MLLETRSQPPRPPPPPSSSLPAATQCCLCVHARQGLLRIKFTMLCMLRQNAAKLMAPINQPLLSSLRTTDLPPPTPPTPLPHPPQYRQTRRDGLALVGATAARPRAVRQRSGLVHAARGGSMAHVLCECGGGMGSAAACLKQCRRTAAAAAVASYRRAFAVYLGQDSTGTKRGRRGEVLSGGKNHAAERAS